MDKKNRTGLRSDLDEAADFIRALWPGVAPSMERQLAARFMFRRLASGGWDAASRNGLIADVAMVRHDAAPVRRRI